MRQGSHICATWPVDKYKIQLTLEGGRKERPHPFFAESFLPMSTPTTNSERPRYKRPHGTVCCVHVCTWVGLDALQSTGDGEGTSSSTTHTLPHHRITTAPLQFQLGLGGLESGQATIIACRRTVSMYNGPILVCSLTFQPFPSPSEAKTGQEENHRKENPPSATVSRPGARPNRIIQGTASGTALVAGAGGC